MKKILLLLLVIISTTSLFAIKINEKGIRLGMSLSTSKGDYIAEPDYKAGFAASVFANTQVYNNFYLQTEFAYTEKGEIVDPKSFSFEAKTKLNYLELPVLIKYQFAPTQNIKLAPFTGIAPSYCIYNRLKTEYSYINYKYSGSVEHLEEYDFGLLFGFDMVYKLNKQHSLVFDARFNLGLLDRSDENDGIKNRNFIFSIGYLIN